MSDTREKTPKSIQPKRSRLLGVVLLLFMITSSSFGYFFYTTQKQYIARLNALDEQQHLFAEKNQELLDTLKLDIAKIQTLDKNDSDQQWALHQAQYAIQLAQLNAKWGNDTATTLALLQQADHLLSQHHDAALFPVRQALARETTSIKNTPTLDMPGLLSQLDALQQLISQYTLTQPITTQTETASEKMTDKPKQNAWYPHFKNTLLFFRQLFVIRHHDSPLEPLMSPAFQAAQKEIIRLNLQEATWAVLQRDDTIYQLALKQARENLIRAFGESEQTIINILKQLDELRNITLRAETFVPHESEQLLETILQHTSSTESGVTP